MPKKIIDISPPQKESPSLPTSAGLKKKPHFPFWLKISLVFLVLILGVIVWLSFHSQLTLGVKPKTDLEKFQQIVEVNISQIEVDFQNAVIPGQFFKKEKEKWETFQASGIDFEAKNARGVIRVYNAHTPPTPLTLREKTRFLSSEGGKIFRALKKIYLPPAKVINGKVIPSEVAVEVEAQEPGEDYNIGPSKFSVPGLAGTAFYYTIWGESEKNMEGGFKKEVKKITTQDIEEAKEKLKEDLYQLAKNSLKSQIPEDFVLVEDAIFEEDSQISCFGKPEDRLSEFNCQGKIKIKGLGFELADLKELATKLLLNKIPSVKSFWPDSLKLNFSPQTLIPEEGKMILNLEVEVETYTKISKVTLTSQIKGLSKTEIEKIVSESWPQVEKIEFKFWPFWIKKAPHNPERIKIKLIP